MSSSPPPPSCNKLVLSGPVWLASDIHLGPQNPKTAQAFYAFLDKARAQASALLLLGDVFDVWIGDDCIEQPEPWLKEALAQLRAVGQHIPLWIGHGNRDFLMGSRLAREVHAQMLAPQTILEVGPMRLLLAHGDEFCTSDLAYQRFRAVVRHAWVQRAFLWLTKRQRQAIAHRARQKSQQTQSEQNAIWHDVQLQSIAKRLSETGLETLIHGHTHRPGHYVDAHQCVPIDRWVLPDWEADHLGAQDIARGGWIVVNEDGVCLHQPHINAKTESSQQHSPG